MVTNPLGITWTAPFFSLPKEGMDGEALFILQKNIVGMVWHTMGVFENNPSTLPQTETILNGQSVGGISIHQLEQIKHYGDAAYVLIQSLKEKSFSASIDFAKKLHAVVSRDETLVWGELRHLQVHIHDVDFVPPDVEKLPALADLGFTYLNEQIHSPIERAILTFLFMAKTQFFFDGNKRTALLMMYGILLSNGYYPIVVLRDTIERFNYTLRRFYETSDASEMLQYFSDLCKIQYPCTPITS